MDRPMIVRNFVSPCPKELSSGSSDGVMLPSKWSLCLCLPVCVSTLERPTFRIGNVRIFLGESLPPKWIAVAPTAIHFRRK